AWPTTLACGQRLATSVSNTPLLTVTLVPNRAMVSVLYFCGNCGVLTDQGVWVAASTVGAMMPRMRLSGWAVGSHSCCSVRPAAADAVLQARRMSLQPWAKRTSQAFFVCSTIC